MPVLNEKRALVITTEVWALAARISIVLSRAGFSVAALSPLGGLTRKTKAIDEHYIYLPWSGAKSVERAIRHWSPDILIPTDDQATAHLHFLHSRSTRQGTDAGSLARLIEISLGDPAYFETAREKSKFIMQAQALGVRCPATVILSDDRKAEPEFSGLKFPVVVKADGTHGGEGVRLAKDFAEMRNAIGQLKKRKPRDLHSLFHGRFLSNDKSFSPRAICVQQFIEGRSANRALVCSNGKVLAGINVEVIQSQSAFGPASVLRIIDQPEMSTIAERLVEKFRLSGFVGFDFMIDGKGQLWLLEMNHRATPSSRIPTTTGKDLAAAIYSQIAGKAVHSLAQGKTSNEIVVLFPQELMRDPKSAYLDSSGSHLYDVPWHEPQLVHACISYALEKGIKKRIRQKLGIGMIGFM
jgi:glutathione synthase/RimK-type ligase-like ATP-grasp enzyme